MEKNLNNSHAMGTDSITRLMWRFSLPAIVGMLANALYNIVDRLFVGQTVGAAGIGAISVVFPFMILVISFDLLVGVGAGSLISISLGEKLTKVRVPARQLAHRSGKPLSASVVNPYVKIGHGLGTSLVDAGCACAADTCYVRLL